MYVELFCKFNFHYLHKYMGQLVNDVEIFLLYTSLHCILGAYGKVLSPTMLACILPWEMTYSMMQPVGLHF